MTVDFSSRRHLTAGEFARQRKPLPKEILAMRSGKLRSQEMKNAVNSPETAQKANS